MASTSNKLEDIVVFELVDTSVVTEKLSEEEITISTSSIHNWDIPSIVCHRIVKVQADRSRLSQKSCYFHSLLNGNFSESRLNHISIHWSMESILNVLQFIYGYQLIVTSTNFLNLLEAALFFGVDSLLLDCEAWFQKFTSGFGLCRHQISLATIIKISNFSLEHDEICLQELLQSWERAKTILLETLVEGLLGTSYWTQLQSCHYFGSYHWIYATLSKVDLTAQVILKGFI